MTPSTEVKWATGDKRSNFRTGSSLRYRVQGILSVEVTGRERWRMTEPAVQRPWGWNNWACPRNCQNSMYLEYRWARAESIRDWGLRGKKWPWNHSKDFILWKSLRVAKEGMTWPKWSLARRGWRENSRWAWNILQHQKSKEGSQHREITHVNFLSSRKLKGRE